MAALQIFDNSYGQTLCHVVSRLLHVLPSIAFSGLLTPE